MLAKDANWCECPLCVKYSGTAEYLKLCKLLIDDDQSEAFGEQELVNL